MAREHDYLGFYRYEVAARRELGYPPSGYLISIRIDGEDVERVVRSAGQLAGDCSTLAREHSVQLLGPSEAPLQRLKGRTRWLLLLKGANRVGIRKVARMALSAKSADPGVRITVDVDPYAML
jgi:primosomal protein N' (replication factor Y)